jgi:hypothetical protein
MIHLLALTFIATAVVLLNRTASATLSSRFLKHIGYAFMTILFFRLGAVIMAVSKSLISLQYLGWQQSSHLDINQAKQAAVAFDQVACTWTAISLILSYVSTFWLFLAWWLLKQYPDESIPKQFYISAIATLSVLVSLAAGIVGVAHADPLGLLRIVDVLTAATVILLVGWRLMKLEPEKGHRALASVVFLFYACWGLMQIPMVWFANALNPTYFTVLMLSAFGAMLSTVLHSSMVLREQPEFETRPHESIF